MQLIVACEDCGEYEGEGLFGVFTDEKSLIAGLNKIYFGEDYEDCDLELRHNGSVIVMAMHRNLKTASRAYKYGHVVAKWNLYRVEVDEPVCL
jgi:hypothetical protein